MSDRKNNYWVYLDLLVCEPFADRSFDSSTRTLDCHRLRHCQRRTNHWRCSHLRSQRSCTDYWPAHVHSHRDTRCSRSRTRDGFRQLRSGRISLLSVCIPTLLHPCERSERRADVQRRHPVDWPCHREWFFRRRRTESDVSPAKLRRRTDRNQCIEWRRHSYSSNAIDKSLPTSIHRSDKNHSSCRCSTSVENLLLGQSQRSAVIKRVIRERPVRWPAGESESIESSCWAVQQSLGELELLCPSRLLLSLRTKWENFADEKR